MGCGYSASALAGDGPSKYAPAAPPVPAPKASFSYKKNKLPPASKSGTGAVKMKLKDLRLASDDFSDLKVLGRGSFGKVYRGDMPDPHNKNAPPIKVAIKKLNPDSFQGYQEWLKEILVLDKLQHPNLVRLVGYCSEKGEACLVYELCELGALNDALIKGVGPNRDVLPWSSRVDIALGFCEGVGYLHSHNMIHRDFKASNILLAEGYRVRLADFGFARAGPDGEKQHVSTRVMGTLGYLDPMYMETGRLTKKSDVYAVGVTLLELVTGRKSIFDGGTQSLITWIRPILEQRKPGLNSFVDPMMGDNYSKAGVVKMSILAKKCIQDDPALRPDMDVLIHNLKQVDRE